MNTHTWSTLISLHMAIFIMTNCSHISFNEINIKIIIYFSNLIEFRIQIYLKWSILRNGQRWHMHLGFLILKKYYFEFEQKFSEMYIQNDCCNH